MQGAGYLPAAPGCVTGSHGTRASGGRVAHGPTAPGLAGREVFPLNLLAVTPSITAGTAGQRISQPAALLENIWKLFYCHSLAFLNGNISFVV